MTDHRPIDAIGTALLALAISTAALPALADPYDYRDRSDTLTSSAGNANASNIAVHTVDPWPRHAMNRRIPLNGRRAGLAITRYQQNKSIDPKGLDIAPVSDSQGQSGTSVAK